jgi:purine catabolism regulator
MPWEINFAQVTEEILAHMVSHQARIIERSELIHRELTNVALRATSLDDIAAALSGLLGRAVAFTDGTGDALCAAGQPPQGERLQAAIRCWLDEQGALRQIRECNAAVKFPPTPDAAVPGGLACGMRIRGELVGIVWLSGDTAALGELDTRAAEHAAVIAALHLSHQRELSLQEARLGYAFVDALLEGRFVASPSSLERAKLSGWDPQSPYRVCLVLLDEPMPLSKDGFARREHWVERLRSQLEAMRLPALLSVTLNQITFLLPAEVDPESVWTAVLDPRCALAVSRVWRGAEGMAAGAADATGLIPLLRPGKLHQFDEMLFARVLRGDENARAVFLARIIDPLRDQRGGEALLETLAALASEGFQLVQTAKRLGIHVSTLRYRVEKIEALLGRSIDDNDTRFELQVAMRLTRLDDA